MIKQSDLITLPLFPFNTVVFPYGRLRLHIFESRYIRWVKQSLKHGADFGIVTMLPSENASGDGLSKIYPLGTRVSMVDFNQTTDGLLGIIVKGQMCLKYRTTGLKRMA